ncbi:MAG: ral nucleoside transport system ATP-binding protein [Rhodospirillaceae bacterium]|nr:ral nucleoside transport system ATP-binding protein [Rhodospirillaceae bacterium]
MSPTAEKTASVSNEPVREPPPAIELRHIDKRFGNVDANRDVSLTIRRGSITGIVGENGAGKSTLMSILYGFYEADGGEILVDGEARRIRTPNDAIAASIGMVHQHFVLVDTFTVLENIMLGAEGGAILGRGAAAARREIERVEHEYGLGVDPDARVSELPVGAQQRVEILKALYRGAEILILDEPTGVLTPQETDQLFRVLATLRARGTTIILITHKLREIMAATDDVYVMRAGSVVAFRRTVETSSEELAELMVGRKIRLTVDKAPANPGRALLRVEDLSLHDERGVLRLDHVSLELRAGEIVGIAGVSGNGQSELLEVLAGIRAPQGGRIVVDGREITAAKPCDPAGMRALGLAHVPEDRHRLGLVTGFAASESAVLGYQRDPAYAGRLLLDRRAVDRHCASLMEKFDVRPRAPGLRSASFSGGNQQKLIIARELARGPRVLLVGQPTRGVDIGAIEFIHRQLLRRRDAGAAILLVSVELEEIMALADRILVMCAGRIVGEVAASDADERRLGLLMANARPAIENADTAAVSRAGALA